MQYNNFEIFRVREPLVPVETMEKKQQVAAFAWEPAGDRFALVLGDVPKLEVTFYTMKVELHRRYELCASIALCLCDLVVLLGHHDNTFLTQLIIVRAISFVVAAFCRTTGRGWQERTPRVGDVARTTFQPYLLVADGKHLSFGRYGGRCGASQRAA